MIDITNLRELMTVEQLSKLVRGHEGPFHRPSQLIGSIITCPFCGNKAVIVAPDMPLDDNAPCHCIVGPYSGNIYGHYCAKNKFKLDIIRKAGMFVNLNMLDVPKPFKWFAENGHKF